MASTMAAAAAHSMPPFPLPAVPRIRPPPIPKGTPGPNTLPMPLVGPEGGIRKQVWADGRWRNRNSNASKHRTELVSRQLEKSLRHETHGMDIYAYRHIRTQQVVYSLTKNMENNKIMDQLMYHGKKTVPAALRRDVWRPYFSIHFPKTPAGAAKGLRVYTELRELATRRQLDPPKELTKTTMADIESIKKSYEPVEFKDKTEAELIARNDKRLDLPILGRRLPKKLLAKKLMNQKATSVADVAAVLARQASSKKTPRQQLEHAKNKKKEREAALSARAMRRLQTIKKEEAKKAEVIKGRQEVLAYTEGQAPLDKHMKTRLSMEYEGAVGHHSSTLDFISESDHMTALEIGAQERLLLALEKIQDEKNATREKIEREMSAVVDQDLARKTEAERKQIEDDVAKERVQKEAEVEAKVTQAQEKLKQERDELRALYEKQVNEEKGREKEEGGKGRPHFVRGQKPSDETFRALRTLQREGQSQILSMKIEEKQRHLKWNGPYSDIPTAIDKALASIDHMWKDQLNQLRAQVTEERERNQNPINHEVTIRWADIRDGTYAREWDQSVIHAELEPRAVTQLLTHRPTTHAHFDEDENFISAQHMQIRKANGSSPHVFGSELADPEAGQTPRYIHGSESAAQFARARETRVHQWTLTNTIRQRENILSLRRRCAALKAQFTGTEVPAKQLPQANNSNLALTYALQESEVLATYDAMSESFDNSLKYIDEQIQYIRSNAFYANDELALASAKLPVSTTFEAETARLKYINTSADLLTLETRNPEAKAQANLKEDFWAKFDERESIEDRVEEFRENSAMQGSYRQAVSELEDFDVNFPLCKEAMERFDRGEIEDSAMATGVGQQSLADELLLSARRERNPDATGGQARSRSATPETEPGAEAEPGIPPTSLQLKRRAIRNDKTAWLDFKRAGGATAFYARGGKASEGGDVFGTLSTGGRREAGEKKEPLAKIRERERLRAREIEVTENEKMGIWAKVRGWFGGR